MDISTPASESAALPASQKPTLLSTVSDVIRSLEESFFPIPPASHLHLYSQDPQNIDILNNIINTSSAIATNLAGHYAAEDPKYVARAQEYTNHADLYLKPRSYALLATEKAKTRSKHFGLDVPIDSSHLPRWIEMHVGNIFKESGMEHFRESENGTVTLTGAGSSLVIDIVLESLQQTPTVQLKSLKVHLPTGSESGGISAGGEMDLALVDTLLQTSFVAFLTEAQKPEADCKLAARLSDSFRKNIESLMVFDSMSAANPSLGGGDRWFQEIELVSKIAEDLAAKEADHVARSLGVRLAPLDIFLRRGHSLAIPYLLSPSLTFLVHISAQTYLTLLGTSNSPEPYPPLSAHTDVPIASLRNYLTKPRDPHSFITATLSLSPLKVESSPTILTPSFPLLADPLDSLSLNLTFVPEAHLNHTFIATDSHGFILDLGGLVMRRESLSALTMGDLMMGMNIGADYPNVYRGTSWVDLLIDPECTQSASRYSSTYASTKSPAPHPPLRAALANPSEPGFFFGKIRVSRMAEVWRILEAAREQCWLNDTLRSFGWKRDTPGDTVPVVSEDESGNADASVEEELEALMNGTFYPPEIPIQVKVLSTFPGPSLQLTMPLPGLGAPLLSLSISHDPLSVRGVRVDVPLPQMADILDLNSPFVKIASWKESMEEIVRRGGTRLLSGWIWGRLKTTA